MRVIKFLIWLLAALGLLAVGFCWVLPRVMFYEIYQKEAEITSSAVAQAAGRDLTLLCQTCRKHPEWFRDEPPLAPAWTPASILKCNPSWVQITPEGGRVEFGGGFHHFGYSVGLSSQPNDGNPNVTWIVRFYSEDSADRELGQFTLTPDEILTQDEFVDRAMAEFDRRIAKLDAPTVSDDASVERCAFAIKHNQVSRLRRAIQDTARQNSNAWRDVLLAYVIDFPVDAEGATERLRRWADAKGDFSAWLMAAYAFDKVGQSDAAEDAVLRACVFPADDPRWSSMHARARGYSMCCRLYTGGKYDACIKLCENLLAYSGAGEHMAGSVLAIRNAARSAQTSGTPEALPAIETGRPNNFDPFEGIDVDVLRGDR